MSLLRYLQVAFYTKFGRCPGNRYQGIPHRDVDCPSTSLRLDD